MATMEGVHDEQDDHMSVVQAFMHIVFLRNSILAAARHCLHTDENLDTFRVFASEIRRLHACVVALLRTINVPPEEVRGTGLRITEEAWLVTPLSAVTHLEYFLHTLCTVEEFITAENANFMIPHFNAIHTGHFTRVFSYIQDAFEKLDSGFSRPEETVNSDSAADADDDNDDDDNDDDDNDDDDVSFEEVDPMAEAVGATEEQINSLPIIYALGMGEQQCNICLQRIVDGNELKQLHCSHFFHKKCLDSWLENSASCPLDRLEAFGSPTSK